MNSPRRAPICTVLCATAVLLAAHRAHAQTAPPPPPPPAADAPASPPRAPDAPTTATTTTTTTTPAWRPVTLPAPPSTLALDPHSRGVQNYRGRPRPMGAGEAALWVPRVIFSPLWLVSEFVIRRPVRAIISGVESTRAPVYIATIFRPTPNFSWAPSASFDFGFAPMFGAGFTWNNALVQGNQLRVVGTTGGADYIDVMARDRWTFGTVRIGIRGAYFDRPDRIFFGLGPDTVIGDVSRYRRRYADGFLLFDWMPTSHFQMAVETGYRAETTGPGVRGGGGLNTPPSVPINERFDVQDPRVVPGFGPLDLFLARGQVTLDSRRHTDQASGARLWVDALVGVDVFNQNRRFGVAQALLEGAIEIMRPGRVLVGSVYVADSVAFGSEPVPFTYLPTLGGPIHQGFRYGRFVGQSAVVAELDYRYPIWSRLDAVWMASVGNVFGHHFEGFRPGALTGSAGVGVRLRLDGSAPIEALFALGSSRFDQPFAIEGFRVYLGVNRGL